MPAGATTPGKVNLLNKLVGVLSAFGMLLANALLIQRDILPSWSAGTPPQLAAASLEPDAALQSQVAIQSGQGDRLGTNWTVTRRTGDFINVHSHTWLDEIELSSGFTIPMMLVETQLTYSAAGSLDSLCVRLYSSGVFLTITGEFIPPADFACQWQMGGRRGSFLLPYQVTRSLGDPLRPLAAMTDLKIGQTWRLEILNPVAHFLPGSLGAEAETSSVLLRVVEHTRLKGPDGVFRPAKLVEGSGPSGLKIWVGEDGKVLRQEMKLPLLGVIRLADEPFDAAYRKHMIEEWSHE